MKYQTLITELEELSSLLGLTLRYEKGDFDGGYCIVKDERMLVVNKKLPDQRKASVLARALNEYGLDNMFIKPALREYIEDEVARQKTTSRQNQKKTTTSDQ
jgi:hypothetical protein